MYKEKKAITVIQEPGGKIPSTQRKNQIKTNEFMMVSTVYYNRM